jgi:PBP1b-binding outer membrane lipoprotein LpoB
VATVVFVYQNNRTNKQLNKKQNYKNNSLVDTEACAAKGVGIGDPFLYERCNNKQSNKHQKEQQITQKQGSWIDRKRTLKVSARSATCHVMGSSTNYAAPTLCEIALQRQLYAI